MVALRTRWRPGGRGFLVWGLTALLCGATAGLVWLGYRATREWQRSTALLVEGRAEPMLALLSKALTQDMKGAQVSVLLPLESASLAEEPPFELRETFARAFARFPYPESFFAWKQNGAAQTGPSQGTGYVFNRADRPPPWTDPTPESAYPVVLLRDPPRARELLLQARREVSHGRRFAVFESEMAGAPYQVIVQRLDDRSNGTSGLVGFTVNLAWIRERYLGDLARQIARIGGGEESISLAILDEAGKTVAATGPIGSGPVHERRFPLLFYDPAMKSMLSQGSVSIPQWKIRVGVARGGAVGAVRGAAWRTFLLLAVSAGATVAGMLLTARAVRARSELAAMKWEFVSTVTHELKTPLALIRLVGDTLSLGRYTSTETIREYSNLLSQEARKLTRLIENLLTFARASDGRGSYALEELEVGDLVDDALENFRPRLVEHGFDVTVDVPVETPKVRADRGAMLHVLDNLIDNAIKYSGEDCKITIRSRASEGRVRLEVVDRGHGIPQADLPRVFEKFYRGRAVRVEGSGLGLAIVQRIVEDHGGRVEIASVAGQGTQVSLILRAGSP